MERERAVLKALLKLWLRVQYGALSPMIDKFIADNQLEFVEKHFLMERLIEALNELIVEYRQKM